MIATTKKLSESPLFDGACPKCNGHGKTVTIAQTEHGTSFYSECSECFGETRISDALRLRKEKGSQLREMMIDKKLTMREACEKFGGKIMDWQDAKNGKASLKDILIKVDKVSVLPDAEKPNPIKELQRGDKIQNLETKEIWTVNANFGDGLIIFDCDNEIQTITNFEGWKKFEKPNVRG